MPVVTVHGWDTLSSSTLVIRQGAMLAEGVSLSASRAVSLVGPILLGGLAWEICAVDTANFLSLLRRVFRALLRESRRGLRERRDEEADESDGGHGQPFARIPSAGSTDSSARSVRRLVNFLSFLSRAAALAMMCLFVAYTFGDLQIQCGAWPHAIVGLGAASTSIILLSVIINAFYTFDQSARWPFALLLAFLLAHTGLSFASLITWRGGLRPSGAACYLRIARLFGIFYAGTMAYLSSLPLCLIRKRARISAPPQSGAFRHRRKDSDSTTASFSTLLGFIKRIRSVGLPLASGDAIEPRAHASTSLEEQRQRDQQAIIRSENVSFLHTNGGAVQIIRAHSDTTSSLHALHQPTAVRMQHRDVGSQAQAMGQIQLSDEHLSVLWAIPVRNVVLHYALWWFAAWLVPVGGVVIAFVDWSAILTFLYYPISVVLLVLFCGRLSLPPPTVLIYGPRPAASAVEPRTVQSGPQTAVAPPRGPRSSQVDTQGKVEHAVMPKTDEKREESRREIAANADIRLSQDDGTADDEHHKSDTKIRSRIRQLVRDTRVLSFNPFTSSMNDHGEDRVHEWQSESNDDGANRRMSPSTRRSSNRVSPSTKRSSNPKSTSSDSVIDRYEFTTTRKAVRKSSEASGNPGGQSVAVISTPPIIHQRSSSIHRPVVPDGFSSELGTTALRPGPRKRVKSSLRLREMSATDTLSDNDKEEELRVETDPHHTANTSTQSSRTSFGDVKKRRSDEHFGATNYRTWMLTPTTEVSEHETVTTLHLPQTGTNRHGASRPAEMERSRTEPIKTSPIIVGATNMQGQTTVDSFGVRRGSEMLRSQSSLGNVSANKNEATDSENDSSPHVKTMAMHSSEQASVSSVSNRVRSSSAGTQQTLDAYLTPSSGGGRSSAEILSSFARAAVGEESRRPSRKSSKSEENLRYQFRTSQKQAEKVKSPRAKSAYYDTNPLTKGDLQVTPFADDEVEDDDEVTSSVLRQAKMGASIDLSNAIDVDERPSWAIERERKELDRPQHADLSAGIEAIDQDLLFQIIDQRGFPKEDRTSSRQSNRDSPTLALFKQAYPQSHSSFRQDDELTAAASRRPNSPVLHRDQMTESSFGMRDISNNPRVVELESAKRTNLAAERKRREFAALAAAAVVEAAPHRRRKAGGSRQELEEGDEVASETAQSLITPVGWIHASTPPTSPGKGVIKRPRIRGSAKGPRPQVSLSHLTDNSGTSGSGSHSGSGVGANLKANAPLSETDNAVGSDAVHAGLDDLLLVHQELPASFTLPPAQPFLRSRSGSHSGSASTPTTSSGGASNDAQSRTSLPSGYGERGAIHFSNLLKQGEKQQQHQQQQLSSRILNKYSTASMPFLRSAPMTGVTGDGLRQRSDESVMSIRSLSRVDEGAELPSSPALVRNAISFASVPAIGKGKDRQLIEEDEDAEEDENDDDEYFNSPVMHQHSPPSSPQRSASKKNNRLPLPYNRSDRSIHSAMANVIDEEKSLEGE